MWTRPPVRHPFAVASHGGLASRPLRPWVASLPVCALATASQGVWFSDACSMRDVAGMYGWKCPPWSGDDPLGQLRHPVMAYTPLRSGLVGELNPRLFGYPCGVIAVAAIGECVAVPSREGQ